MNLPTFLRPCALALVAVALTACGGKASFSLAGTATGLVYSGLVISTNGMDLPIAPIPPAAATPNTVPAVPFSFPNSISYGDVYAVTIKSQPAHQGCDLIDPVTGRDTSTDTAGRTTAIAIAVRCSVLTHKIGGTVSGLATGQTLVLTNGSNGTATITANGAYSFGNLVAYNVSYGVTVLTQPTGQTCTVTNGNGIMGDHDIPSTDFPAPSIDVTCQ
jgi:hypothetical protein